MFITIEAIDGAGKSTQVKILAEKILAMGYDVTLTREPGGTVGANEIRKLILSGEADRWSPMSELLLFTAARRDHVEKTIRPVLDRGGIVICDRYLDTTRAYQGMRESGLRKTVDALHNECIGLLPDLTILLDIDPEVAFDRANCRNDASSVDEGRFESLGLDFQQNLRREFLRIAADEPHRFICIDADRRVEDVALSIELEVLSRLAVTPKTVVV